MEWQPIDTAPRDGTVIVIDPRTPDIPERIKVPGPVTARWGVSEEFAEYGEGWIIYEGRYSVLFAPWAVAWLPLPKPSSFVLP